jgi:MoaA/NifB/PqqE/SkfB family radical SAM enzyme
MDYDNSTRVIDGWQTQGEPMMHPRCFDMVRDAANKGSRVSITTNLTLLNGRRATACVGSGLDTLRVSNDGATAAERI